MWPLAKETGGIARIDVGTAQIRKTPLTSGSLGP